ncbi:MAG: hypothetical protein C5S48_10075 [Candidatus Methanogaster sp.]|nr:MAG: hypothetical protein C5S48_10075 [ANME-2 cluster archaeon]
MCMCKVTNLALKSTEPAQLNTLASSLAVDGGHALSSSTQSATLINLLPHPKILNDYRFFQIIDSVNHPISTSNSNYGLEFCLDHTIITLFE